MAILASDNFDRANAATLGANWSVPTDYSPGIQSNGVDVTGTDFFAGARYSAITWPNDHYSQATFVALAANFQAVTARVSPSAETMYAAGIPVNETATQELFVWKWVVGTFTSIAASGYTVVAGNVIRLEVEGTTLRVYANDVLKITTTDSSISTGSAGLRAWHTAQDVILFNDWSGGDFAAAGGQPTQRRMGLVTYGRAMAIGAEGQKVV